MKRQRVAALKEEVLAARESLATDLLSLPGTLHTPSFLPPSRLLHLSCLLQDISRKEQRKAPDSEQSHVRCSATMLELHLDAFSHVAGMRDAWRKRRSGTAKDASHTMQMIDAVEQFLLHDAILGAWLADERGVDGGVRHGDGSVDASGYLWLVTLFGLEETMVSAYSSLDEGEADHCIGLLLAHGQGEPMPKWRRALLDVRGLVEHQKTCEEPSRTDVSVLDEEEEAGDGDGERVRTFLTAMRWEVDGDEGESSTQDVFDSVLKQQMEADQIQRMAGRQFPLHAGGTQGVGSDPSVALDEVGRKEGPSLLHVSSLVNEARSGGEERGAAVPLSCLLAQQVCQQTKRGETSLLIAWLQDRTIMCDCHELWLFVLREVPGAFLSLSVFLAALQVHSGLQEDSAVESDLLVGLEELLFGFLGQLDLDSQMAVLHWCSCRQEPLTWRLSSGFLGTVDISRAQMSLCNRLVADSLSSPAYLSEVTTVIFMHMAGTIERLLEAGISGGGKQAQLTSELLRWLCGFLAPGVHYESDSKPGAVLCVLGRLMRTASFLSRLDGSPLLRANLMDMVETITTVSCPHHGKPLIEASALQRTLILPLLSPTSPAPALRYALDILAKTLSSGAKQTESLDSSLQWLQGAPWPILVSLCGLIDCRSLLPLAVVSQAFCLVKQMLAVLLEYHGMQKAQQLPGRVCLELLQGPLSPEATQMLSSLLPMLGTQSQVLLHPTHTYLTGGDANAWPLPPSLSTLLTAESRVSPSDEVLSATLDACRTSSAALSFILPRFLSAIDKLEEKLTKTSVARVSEEVLADSTEDEGQRLLRDFLPKVFETLVAGEVAAPAAAADIRCAGILALAEGVFGCSQSPLALTYTLQALTILEEACDASRRRSLCCRLCIAAATLSFRRPDYCCLMVSTFVVEMVKQLKALWVPGLDKELLVMTTGAVEKLHGGLAEMSKAALRDLCATS